MNLLDLNLNPNWLVINLNPYDLYLNLGNLEWLKKQKQKQKQKQKKKQTNKQTNKKLKTKKQKQNKTKQNKNEKCPLICINEAIEKQISTVFFKSRTIISDIKKPLSNMTLWDILSNSSKPFRIKKKKKITISVLLIIN